MRALLLLALLLAPAAARAGTRPAPDALADAVAARALLGPEVWARVVRIDNAGARGAGRRSPYPPTVYALVFELSGILWLYCDADGTQSLSLRRGALAADKADPGPLFQAISPRFGQWAWVDATPPWPARGDPPPNACFIECVAALRRLAAAGGAARAPRLLSYYVDTPTGRRGHTVLLLGAPGALTALDPERSARPVALPAFLGADARALSRYLRGGEVASARLLAIGPDGPAAAGWAALPGPVAPAAGASAAAHPPGSPLIKV